MKSKREKNQTMTELLRAELRKAPSRRGLETLTGVNRLSIARFMRGTQSISLDSADKLAAALGIVSRKEK